MIAPRTVTAEFTHNLAVLIQVKRAPLPPAGQPSSATLSATCKSPPPPTVSTSFSPSRIPLNGYSTLAMTITATRQNALSNSNFNSLAAAGPELTNSCGGTAGSSPAAVSLSGGSLAAGQWRSATILVTASTGTYNNSVTVSSNPVGASSNTATLSVLTPARRSARHLLRF